MLRTTASSSSTPRRSCSTSRPACRSTRRAAAAIRLRPGWTNFAAASSGRRRRCTGSIPIPAAACCSRARPKRARRSSKRWRRGAWKNTISRSSAPRSPRSEGTIDMPLGKISSAEAGWRMVNDRAWPGSDNALAATLLSAMAPLWSSFVPVTGRTHQIRAHAARGVRARNRRRPRLRRPRRSDAAACLAAGRARATASRRST